MRFFGLNNSTHILCTGKMYFVNLICITKVACMDAQIHPSFFIINVINYRRHYINALNIIEYKVEYKIYNLKTDLR